MNNNMEDKELATKREYLIEVAELAPEVVTKMSVTEVETALEQHHQKTIKAHRNPNRFWILNSLPAPQETKPTTSKWGGIWVVIALALALIGAFVMFMVLAFVIK